jgi:hypothetical protein
MEITSELQQKLQQREMPFAAAMRESLPEITEHKCVMGTSGGWEEEVCALGIGIYNCK